MLVHATNKPTGLTIHASDLFLFPLTKQLKDVIKLLTQENKRHPTSIIMIFVFFTISLRIPIIGPRTIAEQGRKLVDVISSQIDCAQSSEKWYSVAKSSALYISRP